MPVIEAQCASILVPHDHRHISHVRSPPMWPWSSSHADRPGLCVVTLQRRKSRGWGTGWIFRLVARAE
jgi:hypothetical protein